MISILDLKAIHSLLGPLLDMGDEVPLYNLCLSQDEFDSLMKEIRSTSYIDEVDSGEQAREESTLWNTVLPVKDVPEDATVDSVIKQAGSKPTALVIANDKSAKSLLVIQLKNGAKVDELKVVPKDVIEICCNLSAANMDLSEVCGAYVKG